LEDKYDLPGILQVKNGYTIADAEKMQAMKVKLVGATHSTDVANFLSANPEVIEDLKDKVRLALQSDTQVTSSKFGAVPFVSQSGKPHLVNQAYASACSVAYDGNQVDAYELFGQIVLEAAYEATLAAALINAAKAENKQKPGRFKVYLTALGGGVFGNKMQWITSAIRKACYKFRDTPLEVAVISYSRQNEDFRKSAQHPLGFLPWVSVREEMELLAASGFAAVPAKESIQRQEAPQVPPPASRRLRGE